MFFPRNRSVLLDLGSKHKKQQKANQQNVQTGNVFGRNKKYKARKR